MIKPTLILDDILDPKKGWPFSKTQVPIERDLTDFGTPIYKLSVDGVDVMVYEVTTWADDEDSIVDPTCIAVMSHIEGLEIDNLRDPCDMFHRLLLDGFGSKGSFCPGFDDDGQGYYLTTLPFAKGFPVDWLRKQFMVNVGLIAEQTRSLEKALAEDSPDVGEDDEGESDDSLQNDSGSKAINAVGFFAGQMLRGFLLG
jgi:hypothetical protein